jgi:phosphatidylglycerophosphate synthase
MHLIGGLLGRPLASLTKHNGRARENHPDDRRGRGAERQVPKPLDTMMRESPEHQTAAASGGADGRSWLTWPNVVTCIRIVGSPGLVVLAMFGQLAGLGALAVALVFTEWLDGFLARALHQESATGARLDTVADAVFYSSLLVAVAALNPQRFSLRLVGSSSPSAVTCSAGLRVGSNSTDYQAITRGRPRVYGSRSALELSAWRWSGRLGHFELR